MALRISDLGTAPTVEETDLVEIAEVDGESPSGYSSYKTTILGIANKIATSTVFSGLVTTAKNIVGAINEIVNGFDDNVIDVIKDLKQVRSATITDGIATFDDVLEENPLVEATATFSPKQGLHGQDAPWAGGAGKNKADCTVREEATSFGIKSEIKANNLIVASGTSSGNGDITVNLNNSIKVLSGQSFTISLHGTDTRSGSFTIFAKIPSYLNIGAVNQNNHALTYTATTDIEIIGFLLRTTSPNTVNVNANFMVELSNSASSDYAPYSNICPISGRDSVKVTRTGVNQWDEVTEVGGISEADGSLNTNANFLRSKNPIRMSHDMTYYVYSKKGNQAVLYYYDENMNYLGFKVSTNLVVTPPENTYYARLRTPNYSTQLYENGDISINYPSTTTEYEPYNGQTHTATFPSTVYEGTYEFVAGTGTETWKAKQIKDCTWSYSSSGQYFATNVSDKKKGIQNIICEILKTSQSSTTSDMTDLSIKGRSADGNVYIKDLSLSSVETLISTYGEYYFAYELATPIEITLTAEQIELLKGTNVLSTDADELKLVASKLANVPDLLTYIQSLEARIKALEEA